MPQDNNEQNEPSRREVASDVPKHSSPIKRMGLILLLVIIATVIVLYKTDRRSIRAYINIPELNEIQSRGQIVFNNNCSSCHGMDGIGDTDIGPPLIHPYYRADILSDEGIIKVIKQGTPEDKWKYGHMPAQITITDVEVNEIIEFYNALRRVNMLAE